MWWGEWGQEVVGFLGGRAVRVQGWLNGWVARAQGWWYVKFN